MLKRPRLTPDHHSARRGLLPAEIEFHSACDWCLDPHLTVGEAIEHLIGEIDRLQHTQAGWRRAKDST